MESILQQDGGGGGDPYIMGLNLSPSLPQEAYPTIPSRAWRAPGHTKRAVNDGASPNRETYPYNCPSYDPIQCLAPSVQDMLSKRLGYVPQQHTMNVFQVKKGVGTFKDVPLTEFAHADEEVVVCFLEWVTTPFETIRLQEEYFRVMLDKYEINPFFVQMLGFPNTGAANFTITYVGHRPHSAHFCLRCPSVTTTIEFALYFQYNFATAKTRVLVLEGKDFPSDNKTTTRTMIKELTRTHRDRAGYDGSPVHPFSYFFPFILSAGAASNETRNKCRNELIRLEMETGTSNYDPGLKLAVNFREMVPETAHKKIEALTRKAHLLGANIAETHKYHHVQSRSVEVCLSGYQKFQKAYAIHIAEDSEGQRLIPLHEFERIEDQLQRQLDLCRGAKMQADNLAKRADIQINMLFNLITQHDNRANARIAEESKRIAEESKRIAIDTRKDSSAMKTIAALTMVFLPGTFVSGVLGMSFFQTNEGRFMVNSKVWIFAAVTVPLTVLVLGLWYVWMWLDGRKFKASGRVNEEMQAWTKKDK